VRDLPKLLLATLTTLLLALGPAAGPATAHHDGGAAHPSSAERHAARVEAREKRHAAREEARAKRHAARLEARERRRAARAEARAKRRAAQEQARANRIATREHEHEQRLANRKAAGAATAAASIAAVLATPCQNTGLDPTSGNQATIRASVLCLINRVRAEHSLQPLTPSPQLEAAAEGHCTELVADDYFAHVSPSGETPVDRIKATGYIPNATVGYVIGENLAWGTYTLSTPQAIVEAWVASPGHLANILESRYTETGIGVTPAVPEALGEGNPGGTYAQEFGVIVE
jgi:uncharacterized protein YkwD